MLTLEVEAQNALKEAAANFPLGAALGALMNLGNAPLGNVTRPYSPAGDALTKEVAGLLSKPSGLRELFKDNVFVSGEAGDRVTELMKALPICVEADKAAAAIRKEKREATAEEAALIAQADAMRDDIVQVNVFDKHGPLEQGIEGYERPAIAQTKAWIDGKHFDGGDFEMYEAQEIADPTAAGKAATA